MILNIGKKIKELRTLCNLTQEELANRTELTKGYISQLENDLAEPSISTLEDIVNALGIDLSEFFKSDERVKMVFSKEDYFVKETEDYKIEWLVPNAQKNEMEPILISINPHSQTDIDYPHEGQEFGFVVDGELLLCFDNKVQKVKKGETFYYDSTKNHYLKNVKDKICKVIWVSSPPNF